MSDRAVSELLGGLATAMRERSVRWYLFGAQAAIVWGSPRLSSDVDVTAAIDVRDTAQWSSMSTERRSR